MHQWYRGPLIAMIYKSNQKVLLLETVSHIWVISKYFLTNFHFRGRDKILRNNIFVIFSSTKMCIFGLPVNYGYSAL